jgi:hypothetical protein
MPLPAGPVPPPGRDIELEMLSGSCQFPHMCDVSRQRSQVMVPLFDVRAWEVPKPGAINANNSSAASRWRKLVPPSSWPRGWCPVATVLFKDGEEPPAGFATHCAVISKLITDHPWNSPPSEVGALTVAEIRQCLSLARLAPMLYMRALALFLIHRAVSNEEIPEASRDACRAAVMGGDKCAGVEAIADILRLASKPPSEADAALWRHLQKINVGNCVYTPETVARNKDHPADVASKADVKADLLAGLSEHYPAALRCMGRIVCSFA